MTGFALGGVYDVAGLLVEHEQGLVLKDDVSGMFSGR